MESTTSNMVAFARKVQQIVAEGDPAKMATVIAETATVWENVDQRPRTFQQIAHFHDELAKRLRSLEFLDSTITATASGYVDQHVKKMTTKDGRAYLVPSCLVIEVRDGRIASVREYMDSGHFPKEVPEARLAAD
jgi:ketosteroid isomerase-like protein